MVRAFEDSPARRRARDLLPARPRAAGRPPDVDAAGARRHRTRRVALLSDLVLPRLDELWERQRAPPRAPVWPTTRAASAAPSSARGRCCSRASTRRSGRCTATSGSSACGARRPTGPTTPAATGGAPYAYLIYPHKPIVAYLPRPRRLLNEYCVEFPDETRPYGSARLPDSDDVLAKWMALTGDERRLIATANMHLPGRQIDPEQVRRDLWRLASGSASGCATPPAATTATPARQRARR